MSDVIISLEKLETKDGSVTVVENGEKEGRGGAENHLSESVDLRDLKKKSVRGGAAAVASQGIGIVIQLTSTVVLGRLLNPEDYGIMAMVMSVTAFAGLFRDMGLSASAIQREELSHAQQSNLFWLNVSAGALLTLVLVAGSPWVAAFYRKAEVRDVISLVAFNFVIGSLGTQCGVALVRKLEFVKKAGTEIVGSIFSLAVSIALALRGHSYWSLAWGGVASAVVTTVALFWISGFRPGLPQAVTGLRGMLRFGASITTFDFINYFHRNLDNLLIGRVCGTEALGLYSRAYSLLMLPINTLRNPIISVGFPAMSRIQQEPEDFRAYYLQVVRLIAMATMPLTAFLFVSTRPIVHLLLGAKWDPICPIFSILATVAFIQPMITLWGMVVTSRGLGRRYVQMGIFNTCCSVAGFGFGLPWGPIGVASGYAGVTYASAIPLLWWAYKGTTLRVPDFIREIATPALASILAGVVAAMALHTLSLLGWMPIGIIFVSGAVFLPAYLLVFGLLPGGQKNLETIWRLVLSKSRGRSR